MQQLNTTDVVALLQRAVALQQQGQLADAAALYRQVLDGAPEQFDALHLLGVVRIQQEDAQEGVALIERALRINPNSARALANHGVGLTRLGRHAEAVASFDKALALNPGHVDALGSRGRALAEIERDQEAIANFDAALALRPDDPSILTNRSLALARLGRHAEALAGFDRALALKPDDVDTLNGRGLALARLHRPADALQALDRALAIRPSAETLNNRGIVLTEIRRFDEAIACYDRAAALDPANALAFSNRGNTLKDMRRFPDALAAYDKALELDPRLAEACNGAGNIFQEMRQYKEALAAYDRAFAINPKLRYAQGARLHAKMHLCDWNGWGDDLARLNAGIANGLPVSTPFASLSIQSDPLVQRRCCEIFVADQHPASPVPLSRRARNPQDRIRLAYVSSDFRQHAVATLTAGLFGAHDRARFEVIGVSLGSDDKSDMRRRLIASFDQFIDAETRSDSEVAELIARLGTDIAIDLNGFTLGNRTNIFAMRPAPIQVSYLGYPGTMGADYIDYILADRIVIPPEHQARYAEKAALLPVTFQVNDAQRSKGGPAPSRSSAGLPDDAVVFCSFNNNYKFTPDMFDVWMRILSQVERGVLWLFASTADAEQNLRQEAARRGIDPARLVFAPTASYDDYLARYRICDLFLDTLPFNAGTTASDALWMGLPLVTCPGHSFAGRMAASLLNAVGLPELTAHSLTEYEALAVKLGRDPALLAATKAKLAQNHMTHPLFDTARITRDIESAYTTMYDTWKKGEPPRSFSVAAN